MQSKAGDQCTVNYMNTSCPYSEFSTNILNGDKGYQLIKINQFTDAYYMVYVSDSLTSQASCTLGNKQFKRMLRASTLNHSDIYKSEMQKSQLLR